MLVMSEITIIVEYYAGSISARFEADEFPEWWSPEVEQQFETKVVDKLLELEDLHTWRSHFETAQQYSRPGKEITPEVGTLEVGDTAEEYTIILEIDSVAAIEDF